MNNLMSDILTMFYNVLCIFYNKTVVIVGIIVSYIFVITGKKDEMIECLLIFMVIDYFTGILKSIYLKKLNSKLGFKGFLKKILMICVVVVAYRLDIILHLTNITYNCRFLTIAFYIANEGLSILENCINSGLKVPEQLREVLEQCKKNKINKGKE